MQAISRRGEDCTKKVGSLCARFFDMGDLVKTQAENGLSKLFNFQGQPIDFYDQSVFILNYSGLHNEEGKKTNVSDPLKSA